MNVMKRVFCILGLLTIPFLAARSQTSTSAQRVEDYPLSFDGNNTYASRTDRGLLGVGFENIKIKKYISHQSTTRNSAEKSFRAIL